MSGSQPKPGGLLHSMQRVSFQELILIEVRMVCPSCVMFGGHKGHEVTEPEQAVRNLRDRFDSNIKSGKLRLY